MAIGIKDYEFWYMNPRKILLYTKGKQKEIQQKLDYDNTIAFVQGQYFMDALLATVGNMLSGKKKEPFKYPEHPYKLGDSTKNATADNPEGLSEEEINRQRENFVARFMAMKANFELNHGKKNG